MQSTPHVAFQGLQSGHHQKKGAPLELIETALSDDELFGEPKANSVIYPEAAVPLSAQVVIRS